MRKVVMYGRLTLDGAFAGPNGEIDWFIYDHDVDAAARATIQPDTYVFGRLTYQMFEKVWPPVAADPTAPEGQRALARELGRKPKVVFSRTLRDVSWENTKVVDGDVAEEVRRLRRGDGPDIMVLGSGSVVQQLTAEGLIDDYWFILTPLVLGRGKPLFDGIENLALELQESRSFEKSGNVLLHYVKQNGAPR